MMSLTVHLAESRSWGGQGRRGRPASPEGEADGVGGLPASLLPDSLSDGMPGVGAQGLWPQPWAQILGPV